MEVRDAAGECSQKNSDRANSDHRVPLEFHNSKIGSYDEP
jgi:hypothetical protein